MGGASTGSAYVYRFDGSTWVQETKLLASDGASGDHFGYSVSVSGDVAVIGADNANSGTGSAYVFSTAISVCPADIVGFDCAVNVTDLLSLLSSWGPCAVPCYQDIDNSGNVNVTDLLILITAWGACP